VLESFGERAWPMLTSSTSETLPTSMQALNAPTLPWETALDGSDDDN
jgi:hypothetical protein